MSFADLLNPQPVKPKSNNGPGKGKKQCKNCEKYIGVRSKICKFCNIPCNREQIKLFSDKPAPQKEYVYEHIRLDTKREKEQSQRIIQNKENLKTEFYWAPIAWRPLCKSKEDLLKRIDSFTLKSLNESTGFIIVKCEVTSITKDSSNKREGKLQRLKVIELCEVR